MMNREKKLDAIPTDLIIEIFSRLPAKSTVRFRILSKQWASILSHPYFSDLFRTRSLARPRLLIAFEGHDESKLYSLPQLLNPYEKSSLVAAADLHMKFVGITSMRGCTYASGLIYYPNMVISLNDKEGSVLYNPTTRQYTILPELRVYTESYSFLGFDPIDNQHKILFKSYDDHRILTLGSGKMRWRKIQQPLTHKPYSDGICINGILYYLGEGFDKMYYMIVCFDVRLENFKFIDARYISDIYYTKLISYKGKLGGIRYNYDTFKLRMYVLEDIEKQECSEYVYTLPENELLSSGYFDVVGVTATGEIVLSEPYVSNRSFYVLYFSPETSTLQSVQIQGFGEDDEERVHVFLDHVEDLKFNMTKTKYASTSKSP